MQNDVNVRALLVRTGGISMLGSRLDTTSPDADDGAMVARVTLAVGRLRVSTETRAPDAVAPQLPLGRSPSADLDPDLGVRLPRFP
ncbi:hypothetical protein CCR97_06555 [Rhodoplanes elegans]|uniref:Uncharacterized protein n=1 Tax=Rhodoplanes elegans TaxID=29408 RepID=A0A327KQ33_9BRAD|nr:hypothetical protein [Rhodoplanes elegans]MBK5957869.1 hypothetical protein [Rhodoplanes elegans]RAI39996.1 hypothetical protein CH338_07650 [Rhodoplanes elegans]